MKLSGRVGQSSQALIEFALVSPVLLLLIFGIIDIGRAVFYYDTISHAAGEGARTAVRASSAPPTNGHGLRTVSTQRTRAPASAPRPPRSVTGANPPANTGWVYTTDPNPPAPLDTKPPMNAPGSECPAAASGSCSAVNPATGNVSIQVTIRFNLVLITPIVSQVTANRILLTAAAIFRTEY